MVDRKDIGSWLQGPPSSGATQDWPGQRLGLPEKGPGSVARFGRRFAAIVADWLICYAIAGWVFPGTQWGTLVIFALENILLVGTLGFTIGHRLFGMKVERMGGGYAGPIKAVIRTVLLCLLVPAFIWDSDQRGVHDKAAQTILRRM